MGKVKAFILILFFLLSSPLKSQIDPKDSRWETFYNGQKIYNILSHNDDLWAGTNYGLVHINLLNNKVTLYNKVTVGEDYSGANPKLILKNGELIFDRWTASYDYLYYEGFNRIGTSVYGINTAAEDENGALWIGSNLGIEKKEIIADKRITTLTFTKENSPLLSNNVRKILFDKEGNLLCALYGDDKEKEPSGGIAKFTGSEWTIQNVTNSPLETNQVTDLLYDKEQNLIIGTNKNFIYKINNGTWEKIPLPKGTLTEPIFQITSFAVDSSNTLWVGAHYNLFQLSKEGNWTVYTPYNSNLRTAKINSIDVDKNGTIWIGTELGLYRFRNNQLEEINTSNSSLSTYYIHRGVKDKKGNIYAIARDLASTAFMYKSGAGIVCYDGKDLSMINVKEIDPNLYSIHSIIVDKSDYLWATTNSGFYKYENNEWVLYDNGYIYGTQVEAICLDNLGNIWFGTSSGQIGKFDGEKFIYFPKSLLPIDLQWINNLHFDGKYIYLSPSHNFNPVIKFDPLLDLKPHNVKVLETPFSDISSIATDSKGDLWISSIYAGVARLSGDKWEVFNRSNSGLLSSEVSEIILDSKNRLVFAYGAYRGLPRISGGISILSDDKWTNYTFEETQLGISFIYSLLEDIESNIWVFGNNGISVLYNNESNMKWDLLAEKASVELYQNFPNPFNSVTIISCYLHQDSQVSLSIYDPLGRRVKKVEDRFLKKGFHSYLWDGEDGQGHKVGSGTYIYGLVVDGMILSKKIIFLK